MNDKLYLPATLVLCLIVLFGWHRFVYEPARREILSMELETQRLRETERELSELKRRHGDLKAFAELKASQLDEARIFLPTELEQDEFIEELYLAAESCGVSIVSIRADEEKFSEVQSQIVSVTLEADYVSLLNFIRVIEDGERLTRLEKFSAARNDGGTLDCEMSFKIFAASP